MSNQTEEEQVERIKEVWHRHGVPVLTGVVLALAGVFGWNGWTNYQENKASNASAVYQSMLENVLQDDSEASRTRGAELAETLRKDYPGTRYASFAALMQARLAVEAGDFDSAEALLRDVAKDGDDLALQEVARQRLARVLGQLERAEEGLELFTVPVTGELLAGREEVRGDLLLSLDRVADARQAYQAALEATPDPRTRPQLQLKLDDLAEEAS
ncbi:GTP-binding protein [Pseudomonas sp. G11-1]|uniref:Ancillary SecYEG translocon subunit n=1 Tax=Halopseudomonas bauzanensis TaxID=653930 RepID=A0A4U0YWH3_9GAMM|nr:MULTISPECIES: tetratricopeptide repeat protein [Halopseudomonas]MCO5785469.1 GTP-binding protein [Pseudomonas sp. G11-1]MCO5788427.1 GTP-binding protein [Pseudomonas sp. G11-2]EZQ19755.1 GTP-binding protein [Halopseudomonas bauzanensis]TKA93453.1 tetratricopeptide repeat protein [Halopseudomonas bauzanensis]WGK61070.1 tetratricopeptide repeat protein [Halopseudomonas sp. SMJS2]